MNKLNICKLVSKIGTNIHFHVCSQIICIFILDYLFSDHLKSLDHSSKLQHFSYQQFKVILLQKCLKKAASLIIYLSVTLNFNISNLAFVIQGTT